MKDWIKKYKLIIIIGAIIIIFSWPFFVNWLYNVETNCKVLHKPQEWTIFWGSYIGSIVSAAVAFIILFLQRKDNIKENEKNRTLQLKILEQQQEMQWLNMFRQASAEYVLAYSDNDIRNVINTMVNNPEKAFECIRILIDRLKKCDISLKYIGLRDNSAKIISTCDNLFITYMEALNDIQKEVVYLMQNKPSLFHVFSETYKDFDFSDKMIQGIKDYNNSRLKDDNTSDIIHFHKIALLRIRELETHIDEIQNTLGNYIKNEEKRIERITTEI